MRLGIHISLKGGFASNLMRVKERAVKPSSSLQATHRLEDKPPNRIEERAWRRSSRSPAVIHSVYLINLATRSEDF